MGGEGREEAGAGCTQVGVGGRMGFGFSEVTIAGCDGCGQSQAGVGLMVRGVEWTGSLPLAQGG